jgi:hypothetical protein
MKKHLPVFLIIILFVMGCASTETIESSKVSPSEIYQEYSISSDSNQTRISTVFRVGGAMGTTVDLDAPSKIEHNGREMAEMAPSFLKGTTYLYQSDQFEPVHQFVYTDASGKVYQNEIRLEALEIDAKSINLSLSAKNKIPLSRRVGDDETVLLTLVSDTRAPQSNVNANKTNENIDIYSLTRPVNLDETRTALVMEPYQLKKFVPGKAKISVEVRKETGLKQAADKGGKMVFTYESADAVANVLN